MRNDWDLPRLAAWNAYSESHPPLHVMVAAYFGIKPKAKPQEASTESNEDMLAFLTSIPGMSVR